MKKQKSERFGTYFLQTFLQKYQYQVQEEDILFGKPIGSERQYFLVDLGLKKISFVPFQEYFFPYATIKHLQAIKVNEFLILKTYLSNAKAIASISKLRWIRLFERLKHVELKNLIIQTELDKKLRGGRLVTFDQLTLIVPNSHLSKFFKRRKKQYFHNQAVPIKILEIKIETKFKKTIRNLVVGSFRLSFFSLYQSTLRMATTKVGTILKIKKYGIFFNIDGIKSLLHISELKQKKKANLYLEFTPGTQMPVRILYVNQTEGRIYLAPAL